MRLGALVLLAVLAATVARAGENLVSGLSQDRIEITSNYAGSDIVVFGAIERPEPDARGDIVVVVRGPDADMRVRRKGRLAGVWINRNRVILRGMPSYYFIAATRDLSAIASPITLRQYGLGLDALTPRRAAGPHDPEPFRQALFRHQKQLGLYVERPGGVRFLSGTLFRVHVPLPALAPRGLYSVEVYLLRDGTVVGAHSTPLDIDQAGIERRLFDFAHLDPLAYGLSAVVIALLLGGLSSLAFRRME